MKAAQLPEETRALLKRIVEALAYRQLTLANIRGNALAQVWELEEKLTLANELVRGLERLRGVRALYRELQHGGNVVSAIRSKMERIPYPATRLELGVCLHLCELAGRISAETYAVSNCDELAAVAAERLASERDDETGDALFIEFCADPQQRPQAQQYFDRWLAICLASLGRPGSKGDARAVALGLRERSCGDIARDYLRRLGPFRERCGLRISDPATLGVVLPPSSR